MKKLYSLLLLALLGTVVASATCHYKMTFSGSQYLIVTYNNEVQTVVDGQEYTYTLSAAGDMVSVKPASFNVSLEQYFVDYGYGYTTSEFSADGYESTEEYTYTYRFTATLLEEKTLTITADAADALSYYIYNRSTNENLTEPTAMTGTTTTVTYIPKSGLLLRIVPTSGKKFYKIDCDGNELYYDSYSNCYSTDLSASPAAISVTTKYPDVNYNITFQYYNYDYSTYSDVLMPDATDVITGVTIDGVATEMTNNTVSLPAGKSLAVAINTKGYNFRYIRDEDYTVYVSDITDGTAEIGLLDSDMTLRVSVEKKVETVEKSLTLTTDVAGKFTYNFYNTRSYTPTTQPATMEATTTTLTYDYPTSGEELVITPTDGNRFYKVRVNDKYDVAAQSEYDYTTGGYKFVYYIYVDDTAESNYGGPVEKVEVLTEYPADATFNVAFQYYNTKTYQTFEANDVITSVTVNGAAATLNADGTLTVKPKDEVAVGINTTDYAFGSIGSTDNTVNVYSLTDGVANLGAILADMTFVVCVAKSVPVNFTLTLDCDPSLVDVQLDYMSVAGLQKGDNAISAEAGQYISVVPQNCELTSITYDGVEQLRSTPYSYTWYGTVNEGMQNMTIKAAEIVRDIPFIFYINRQPDDISYSAGYIAFRFDGASSYRVEPVNGYNTIYTRDADGQFSVLVSCYDGSFNYKAYFNDEEAAVAGYYYSFLPDTNDVIKLFLYTPDEGEPTPYDVTFTTVGEVDNLTATKDHAKSVAVGNNVVEKAVGYTEWTLATDHAIVVDGKMLTATDGVYSFATTGKTNVTIVATNSIGDIAVDNATAGPVYNLQGIRVAADAASANLPAGIYIVNGKKVAIK